MATLTIGAFIVFVLVSIPAATADLIQDSCKHTGSDAELCIQILSADPKSQTADAHMLAHIALEHAVREAATANHVVQQAAEKEAKEGDNDDDEATKCLVDCEEEYEDIVQQLGQSRASMDEKDYNEAVMFVEAALDDLTACEKSCEKVPENKNPFAGQARRVEQLCSVTLALTRLVQR